MNLGCPRAAFQSSRARPLQPIQASPAPAPRRGARASVRAAIEHLLHDRVVSSDAGELMPVTASLALFAVATVLLMVAVRRLMYQARSDRAARAESERQLLYSDQLQQL